MISGFDKLNEKIERNYKDFREETLLLSKDEIFSKAQYISAVEDVIFYITTHDWLNEEDVENLLELQCPLAAMASAYSDYRDYADVDFRTALNSILGSQDSEDDFFDEDDEPDEEDDLEGGY